MVLPTHAFIEHYLGQYSHRGQNNDIAAIVNTGVFSGMKISWDDYYCSMRALIDDGPGGGSKTHMSS